MLLQGRLFSEDEVADAQNDRNRHHAHHDQHRDDGGRRFVELAFVDPAAVHGIVLRVFHIDAPLFVAGGVEHFQLFAVREGDAAVGGIAADVEGDAFAAVEPAVRDLLCAARAAAAVGEDVCRGYIAVSRLPLAVCIRNKIIALY